MSCGDKGSFRHGCTPIASFNLGDSWSSVPIELRASKPPIARATVLAIWVCSIKDRCFHQNDNGKMKVGQSSPSNEVRKFPLKCFNNCESIPSSQCPVRRTQQNHCAMQSLNSSYYIPCLQLLLSTALLLQKDERLILVLYQSLWWTLEYSNHGVRSHRFHGFMIKLSLSASPTEFAEKLSRLV